jgi:predicted Mrr-cat superfamily restriction endonuclease
MSERVAFPYATTGNRHIALQIRVRYDMSKREMRRNMNMNKKNYWLHRVTYENGQAILKNEHRLTIGFSGVAASQAACKAMAEKNYGAFCTAYTAVYKGEIERCKNGLWRFVVEMRIDDIVVVPFPYGFFICKVMGEAVVCNRGKLDLGWERDVEILATCSPRERYANSGLLSRMKCQQTNLNIIDLAQDVDEALDRKRNNTPIDIVGNMSRKLHEELDEHCRPERFEDFVASYFELLGAQATVMSKNYSDKQGDCDVEAVFAALRLTICVQCKKHVDTTDDWAVRQILDYAVQRNEKGEEDNWTYAYWVVSLADKFSDDACRLAHENNVTLVNGDDFCRMLLSVGLR